MIEQRPMRLGVVADIHNGSDTGPKLGSKALPLLDVALERFHSSSVDLVVDLGDRINDSDPVEDARRLEEVAERFRGIALAREHLMGNHDLMHLDSATNAAALQRPLDSRAFELNGWYLVFWQPNVHVRTDDGFWVEPSALRWLGAILASSSLPTIVFSHIPLDGGPMTRNYYFHDRPHLGRHARADEIHRVLRERGHVVATVSGHTHWNQHRVLDGIAHFTLHSLTESSTTIPGPAGAHALLELGFDEMHWRVEGRDRLAMSVPVRGKGRIWPQRPLKNHRAQHEVPRFQLQSGMALLFDAELLESLDGTGIAALKSLLNSVRGSDGRVVVMTQVELSVASPEMRSQLAELAVERQDIWGPKDIVNAWLELMLRGPVRVAVLGSEVNVSGHPLIEVGKCPDEADIVMVGDGRDVSLAELDAAAFALQEGALFISLSGLGHGGGSVQAPCERYLVAASGCTPRRIGALGVDGVQAVLATLSLRPSCVTVLTNDIRWPANPVFGVAYLGNYLGDAEGIAADLRALASKNGGLQDAVGSIAQ